MDNLLNIVILLLALVLRTAFAQLSSTLFKKSKNEGSTLIALGFVASLTVLILCPLFEWKFSFNAITWGALILASIFYAANDRIGATVKKYLDVSFFTIIWQLSNVFLIIVGFVIFKEIPTLEKILGAFLIIAGNIIVTFRGFKGKLNKYFLLAILVEFVFTVAVSIDVGISDQFNLPMYVSLTLIIPTMINFFFQRSSIKSIISDLQGVNKRDFWIFGFIWGIMVVSILSAYQRMDVSFVSPIIALSMLFSVFIGVVFNKEHDYLIQKFIAAILALMGVILLSINLKIF